MMLAAPGLFRPTQSIDVSLDLLQSARPLGNRSRVHFYVHASEVVAEAVFHSTKQMLPGTTSYAQLRLAEPVLVLPGDRFILRQLSPVITIGGGEVLNTVPVPMRKKERLNTIGAFLDVLRNGSDPDILNARIQRHGRKGISIGGITAETGWRKDRVESLLAQASNRIVRFGDALVLSETVDHLKADMVRLLDGYHQKNPLSPGMGREELREKLRLNPAIFSGILKLMEGENIITLTGELINRAGRSIAMNDEERRAKEQIEHVLSSAGLNAPLLQNVLSSLKIDSDRAQKILYLLYREKLLIKIEEDIVFHTNALQDLRRRLAEFKTQSSTISVPQFKELAGVTRRYAIALLEYLDRERITRRVGEERVIL
jgi:selenocysteine-specific elongation factor